tara:strand:+ start:225 stop:437 length:213 start_codon:yes stop_codon:yes gene_type:complete
MGLLGMKSALDLEDFEVVDEYKRKKEDGLSGRFVSPTFSNSFTIRSHFLLKQILVLQGEVLLTVFVLMYF